MQFALNFVRAKLSAEVASVVVFFPRRFQFYGLCLTFYAQKFQHVWLLSIKMLTVSNSWLLEGLNRTFLTRGIGASTMGTSACSTSCCSRTYFSSLVNMWLTFGPQAALLWPLTRGRVILELFLFWPFGELLFFFSFPIFPLLCESINAHKAKSILIGG